MSHKSNRRTREDVEWLCLAILEIVEELKPMTIRQLFYQMVSRGLIPKNEAAYKSIVCRLTAKMRKGKRIPYSWFSDATRWQRKPKSSSSLESYLAEMQQFYRRDVWNDQRLRCEIWLEKESLAGVLWPTTSKYDVPLMVCRGYPSLSFLSTAAEVIEDSGKATRIGYLGDYDPSGKDIVRHVRDSLQELAPEAEITVEELAVNPRQIIEYQLQTRPTKATDSRAKNFKGESVELDAIAPGELRAIAEEFIEGCIDADILKRAKLIEREERLTLAEFIQSFDL